MTTISERLRDPELLHGIPRKVKVCADAADTIDALVDALEPFANVTILSRGNVVGLERFWFVRAVEALAKAKGKQE